MICLIFKLLKIGHVVYDDGHVVSGDNYTLKTASFRRNFKR